VVQVPNPNLVGLDGGELGVVPRGDALVAKDAPDLEHALDAAHHQPLQRQLCEGEQGFEMIGCCLRSKADIDSIVDRLSSATAACRTWANLQQAPQLYQHASDLSTCFMSCVLFVSFWSEQALIGAHHQPLQRQLCSSKHSDWPISLNMRPFSNSCWMPPTNSRFSAGPADDHIW